MCAWISPKSLQLELFWSNCSDCTGFTSMSESVIRAHDCDKVRRSSSQRQMGKLYWRRTALDRLAGTDFIGFTSCARHRFHSLKIKQRQIQGQMGKLCWRKTALDRLDTDCAAETSLSSHLVLIHVPSTDFIVSLERQMCQQRRMHQQNTKTNMLTKTNLQAKLRWCTRCV